MSVSAIVPKKSRGSKKCDEEEEEEEEEERHNFSRFGIAVQEAQLSPKDRTMRRVS